MSKLRSREKPLPVEVELFYYTANLPPAKEMTKAQAEEVIGTLGHYCGKLMAEISKLRRKLRS